MENKPCKNPILKISTNDFIDTIMLSVRQISKDIKSVSFKKVSKQHYLVSFKTDEGRTEFLNNISCYLVNCFLLEHLIKYFSSQKFEIDMRELMIESFFEQNQMFIAYAQQLHGTSFMDFMKDRDELSLPIYMTFNFPGLKEELITFLESGLKMDELLGSLLKKMEEDSDMIISEGHKLRQLVIEGHMDNLANLHCYRDDECIVVDDDSRIEVNSMTFPESSVNIDMFNDSTYIILLLMAFQPEKGLLYQSLEESVIHDVEEFYITHREEFGQMGLYSVSSDNPMDEGDD